LQRVLRELRQSEKLTGGRRPPKKTAGRAMDGPAGVKKVAGTGTEQMRFQSGKQGVESVCDAQCDAFSADRIELLARAVILVAGMNLAEAERVAVLSRVIADLTSPTTQIPE
jgi:hypothetical protein